MWQNHWQRHATFQRQTERKHSNGLHKDTRIHCKQSGKIPPTIRTYQISPEAFEDQTNSLPKALWKNCRLGEGKWWSLSGSFIVFHDSSLRQSFQEPRLPHLGSITSQKHTQILKISWKTCIENFISKKLQLPLLKLKVYADGSLQKVLKNEGKFFYFMFYFSLHKIQYLLIFIDQKTIIIKTCSK